MPSPTSAPEAGFQALIVAACALGFGYLIADALLGKLALTRITLWALALPGIACFVFVLELVHIATGGAVFGSAAVTRLITLGVALLLIARRALRRGQRLTESSEELWIVFGLVALGLLLWCLPVFRLLPLNFSGDTRLHVAWTSQLLNGARTPSLLLTGEAPNSYPWLFHAMLAWLARLTPGGRAFHALAPLQILLVTGAVLGLFALGHQIRGRWAAAAAALFGALSGGFGFVLLRGPDVVTAPRGDEALQYFGDLFIRRSYNLAFHNLVPPYPRELAYCLTISFLLLAVLGLKRESLPLLCGAGVMVGLIGLTSGETLFVSFGTAILLALLAPRGEKGRTALAMLVPALVIYGSWLAPLALNYFRLGGFVDTSAPPVVLPPLAILFSWGTMTPFAVYGATLLLRRGRSDTVARLMLAQLLVAGGAVLSASFLLSLAGPGFANLGRPHRYWPLLYLALSLYAAAGASEVFKRLAIHRKPVAITVASVVLLLAVPSPLLASLAMPENTPSVPLLEAALRGKESTLLNEISPTPGGDCEAAVPPELAPEVASYTGYRLVSYGPDPRARGARQVGMRWRRVPGFISDKQRASDSELLTTGSGSPGKSAAIARRYGVDLVIATSERAAAAFPGAEIQRVDAGRRNYLIVWLTRCED